MFNTRTSAYVARRHLYAFARVGFAYVGRALFRRGLRRNVAYAVQPAWHEIVGWFLFGYELSFKSHRKLIVALKVHNYFELNLVAPLTQGFMQPSLPAMGCCIPMFMFAAPNASARNTDIAITVHGIPRPIDNDLI